MAHFIIFISQTLQVWGNFSSIHRAHIFYYKSKTNKDINTKLTEYDNELWPSMLFKVGTYISINTGVKAGPTYPPPT